MSGGVIGNALPKHKKSKLGNKSIEDVTKASKDKSKDRIKNKKNKKKEFDGLLAGKKGKKSENSRT